MWKLLAGAIVGYLIGEQAGERRASTGAAPRSGASGCKGRRARDPGLRTIQPGNTLRRSQPHGQALGRAPDQAPLVVERGLREPAAVAAKQASRF
jgi:hypothetical protein